MDYHIRNGSSATMCIREFGLEVLTDCQAHKEALWRSRRTPAAIFMSMPVIYVLSPEMLRLLPAGEALDMTRLFEMVLKRG
jgi:hypothetical protein